MSFNILIETFKISLLNIRPDTLWMLQNDKEKEVFRPYSHTTNMGTKK